MKRLPLYLLCLTLPVAFGQEKTSEFDGPFPVMTPSKYEKQAQEERLRNEKSGIELRQNMKKASGLKPTDPNLRPDNEPFDQADHIMRPD